MEVKVDIVPFLRLMVRSQTDGLDKHTDEIRKLLSTIDSALETTKVKIAEAIIFFKAYNEGEDHEMKKRR